MPYDITCMRNLKYAANEPIYRTETCVFQEGKEGGGMDWEFGVNRCNSLEWISNEIRLCSTETYI